MKKLANVLRLFWGCVFLAGVVINIVIGISNPSTYDNGGLHAWPDLLLNFWNNTIVAHMIWFIVLFAVIEVVLGLLILNKGRAAKLGLICASVFGIGLLMLGLGAERTDFLARIPNLLFEAMIIYCLFFDYDKTFIQTIRRKKEKVTVVIGS